MKSFFQIIERPTKTFRHRETKRAKNPQLKLFKSTGTEYGGSLLKSRKGRAQGRFLDTKNSMHLVMRSSKAKAEWSFLTEKNKLLIRRVLEKFSAKYGIKILSQANAGNHLHLHIKLANRYAYVRFIRAITAAIAMGITGASRWNPMKRRKALDGSGTNVKETFWDLRPFTRVIFGYGALQTLKDYLLMNQLENMGMGRDNARLIMSELKYRPVEFLIE